MDVWRLTVAALRRWYILLPLLALTGFGALQAGEGIQPTYEVTATAMMVPGSGGVEVEVANPYGGLDNASQVVAIVLNSNEARAEIQAQGLNPDYQVNAASRSNILNFNVTDPTPAGGIATLDAVLAAAAAELATRQGEAGLPAAAQYGIDTIAAPAVSTVVTEGKTRIMAAVAVIGAALSFLVAVLFDDLVGLIKRARTRRHERKAAKASALKEDSTIAGVEGDQDKTAISGIESDEPGGDAPPAGDDEDDTQNVDGETASDDAVSPETPEAAAGSGDAVDATEPTEPGETASDERMVPAGTER